MSIFLNPNRKSWARINFSINCLTGNIRRLFNPNDIYYKANSVEVEGILNKIESETENFKILRIFTYIKYILSLLSLNVAIAGILLFTFSSVDLMGYVCIGILLFLLLSLCLWCCIVQRRVIKELHMLTSGVIAEANENIFCHKRLYMMPYYDKRSIILYILPKELNDLVRIRNYITPPITSSLVDQNNNSKSYINRKRISAFDSKYSNFSSNHITNLQV